jgi:hypothetical protein
MVQLVESGPRGIVELTVLPETRQAVEYFKTLTSQQKVVRLQLILLANKRVFEYALNLYRFSLLGSEPKKSYQGELERTRSIIEMLSDKEFEKYNALVYSCVDYEKVALRIQDVNIRKMAQEHCGLIYQYQGCGTDISKTSYICHAAAEFVRILNDEINVNIGGAVFDNQICNSPLVDGMMLEIPEIREVFAKKQ